MRPVIVLGAGGHAKVVADALLRAGREILGFLSLDKPAGIQYCGHEVLGDDNVIARFTPDEILLANGIGALPSSRMRWNVGEKMRQQGFSFTQVIHPSAVIAKDVQLEEGVQIMANATVQPGSFIGTDTIINTGTIVDHDCRIGKYSHLAPGVTCCGGVSIGEGTIIGCGVSIIQNIKIGSRVLIGAGAVVFRDIDDNISFIQPKHERQKYVE